jgi:hypothetical protein
VTEYEPDLQPNSLLDRGDHWARSAANETCQRSDEPSEGKRAAQLTPDFQQSAASLGCPVRHA